MAQATTDFFGDEALEDNLGALYAMGGYARTSERRRAFSGSPQTREMRAHEASSDSTMRTVSVGYRRTGARPSASTSSPQPRASVMR
jgi:hypothetical protein